MGTEFGAGGPQMEASQPEAPKPKVYERPKTVGDISLEKRKLFRDVDPNAPDVGGEFLQCTGIRTTTTSEEKAQAEADSYVDGLFSSLTSAARRELAPDEPDGLTVQQKKQNITELVLLGLDMGISAEEIADKLTSQGLTPEDFMPHMPTAAENAAQATEAAKLVAETPLPTEAPEGERLSIFSQEANFLGSRLVSTVAKEHKGTPVAVDYLKIKGLEPLGNDTFGIPGGGSVYTADSPFVLGTEDGQQIPYDQAKLPQIMGTDEQGQPKMMGVRKITGIRVDKSGKKIATVELDSPTDGGAISTIPDELPLDDILAAQAVAEAEGFEALMTESQKAVFALFRASVNGEAAVAEAFKQALAENRNPNKDMQKTAAELHVLTNADIKMYIERERGRLPQGNDPESKQIRTDREQTLLVLESAVGDHLVATPDVVTKMVQSELGLDGSKNLQDQVVDAKNAVSALRDQLKQCITKGGQFSELTDSQREQTKQQLLTRLNAALTRQSQLEILAEANGTRDTVEESLRQFNDKVANGSIDAADAEAIVRGVRSGNLSELILKALPSNPNASAEDIAKQIAFRAKALHTGKGAGMLALVVAALAMSVVDAQGLMK